MNDRADLEARRIGDAVRNRRRHLGLRQRELARLAEVSTRFVHSLEAAKPTLRLDKVAAVLDALGLELAVVRRTPTKAS
jgi:HTH-type transcriptional regulator / antitoxin HipB